MLKGNLPKYSLKGSVIELFKTYIIQEIIEKYNASGKCILILDEKSSHIISNYFSMTDIISQGIFSVELLSKVRKPFETYNAIYIISNTQESVNLLVNDFDNDLNGTPHSSCYKYCHLYIIDPISQNQSILDSLLNQNLLRRIKTFKELYLDYTPLDRNLYYFGQEYYFNPIYQIFCVNDNNLQNNICIKKLYSICLVTQTYPNIIYFVHDQCCKYIATNLNKKLETYYTNHKKIVRNGTLLITSRLMDLPAPIQFDMNYDHLIFESYKSNSDPDKKMINIDLENNGRKKDIILDHNDILYDKYKLYSIYDVLNILPSDLEKFNNSDVAKVNKVSQIKSMNEMSDAIKNFNEYQYKTKLFSQHLDLAKKVNDTCKQRNIMNLIDMQSSIISGSDHKGARLSPDQLNSQFLQNREFFQKNDIMRLLYLIRYYNPDNDVSELADNLQLNINGNDLKLIEFFTLERSLIDEEDMNRINKDIILFRNKNKYNTREEKENKSDKRYLCVKESKLTTICDMCCKNELSETDFEYVVKPKIFNQNINKRNNKANLLIENLDLDLQSDMPLNLDNLIIFNVGGLSTYEISSLEKAKKNKQFNMNIIYGSNQIYNHEEYIKYIQEYFKGNSGIVKAFNYKNNIMNVIKNNYDDEDDYSKDRINRGNDTMQNLNESKEQRVNVNLFNNKVSNITSNITNNTNNFPKDTMNYDFGPVTNSVFKETNQNIRNTIESDFTNDYK